LLLLEVAMDRLWALDHLIHLHDLEGGGTTTLSEEEAGCRTNLM
jgi:hypothetical protein